MYPTCPERRTPGPPRDPHGRRAAAGARQPRSRFAVMRGFVLPTAIFLLVIMASLAAYMVRTFTLEQGGFDMSVQGINAYQAALAGLEWGTYKSLDPDYTWTPGNVLPGCAPTTTLTGLAGGLAAFSVVVTCQVSNYTEGNHLVAVYQYDATATAGAAGTVSYIQRHAQTRVMLCRVNDSNASLRKYAC